MHTAHYNNIIVLTNRKIDEGSKVTIVYMSFSKYFDRVPHGRWVKKVRTQEDFSN